MGFKPAGSPSVSPYLVVADAQASLDFIRAVFDVEPILVHRDGERIKHAEVRIDDSIVMIGEMPGGPSAHVHVYVPDARSTFERAIAAGANVVQPVADQEDNARRGGVQDPTGTVWWFSTPL